MKRIYTYLLVATVFVSSCAKLEQTPDGINTAENIFLEQKDAEAAVNALYTSLTSHDLYNQFSETMQSQGTDDCEWGKGRNTGNAGKLAIDKFTFNPATDVIYRHWQIQYRVINRANVVIANVPPMAINQTKKNQYVGEAYFLRGLMYFNLVRLFGEVPLTNKPTLTLDNLDVAKSSIDQIYQQIINDLKEASTNLPTVYTGSDLGRATKGAAMTLLAKVYLTKKMYVEAAAEAKKVMDLNIYNLWPSYAEVFTIANKNRRESIFEVQYTNTALSGSGYGSSYAGFFRPSALVVKPPTGVLAGNGDNPVTLNHYQAYPAGDLRRNVNVIYIPTAPASVQFPYYVNKYQDPAALTLEDGANDYFIARYADVLLMYAEALHETSIGSNDAYEAFNKVRRRAYGLPINTASSHDLTRGLSLEQFRDSILLERRLEFAFEGQRRFDLLRMGKLKEAINAQDPTILIEDRHLLLPLPQDELIVNKALVQNPGY